QVSAGLIQCRRNELRRPGRLPRRDAVTNLRPSVSGRCCACRAPGSSTQSLPSATLARSAPCGQASAAAVVTATGAGAASPNNRFLSHNATPTRPISTGTSTSGPITAAKATPEPRPNTLMATASASSKLLLAAVNDRLTVFE